MTKKKQDQGKAGERETYRVNAPLPIKIVGWFGIGFSLTFIIYGVVSIVLSFLDRTYQDFGQNLLIIIYGLPILAIAVGFKNMNKWGWYGLCAIFGLSAIISFITFKDINGILVGVLTLLALIALFLPAVRKHYFAA